ncbi:DNA invertase Pin-like site-specific DNA recombinase [Paenibacillus cellulosilyticus]|uniref:DNA invertase Pin-like site-specific DNA recombinase n=1 Tax=Paenibacillus cellulosilyticus TaxID=375489 RepID=A0A2V2YTU0_9BACL|nr:recombinase family protein [Paenibacillus cellulosilyticus]PWW02521.1 DNA invertase Pin-like site-specific DNA recombinase [Paenibacillus cellulosilyticus]QKS47218.1 recombinase family protein [Paenibacillus cellulosilyticus]
MRATFYARVSSDTEEQRSSIDSQVKFFQDYIKEHKHQKAVGGIFCKRDGSAEATDGYYVDEGFSGAKSFKYRRAFQQMIQDAKARKFDMIFVKDIKRFGRNAQETLKYISDLKEVNVGVYFDNIKANTLSRNDDFRIQLFASLAEEESTSKSKSVQWGKMVKYKQGIWGGREPYGYNLKEGKLVKNEAEEKIVLEVFHLFLNESMGQRNIAKTLNASGVPTKSGKTIWDQSLISKMLKNAVYTGEIRLHRTQKTDINRNRFKKIPLEEQIVTQDESLRMIDDETFRLVQDEKAKRFEQFGDFKYKNITIEDDDGNEVTKKQRSIERGLSRHSSKHLFSNLLKCGNCGGSLRRKVQKNHKNTFLYWFCRNNDQFGKHKCGYRNLQHEEMLIKFVKKEIVKYRNTPNKRKYYLQTILKTRYNAKDIVDRKQQLQNEIDETKAIKKGILKQVALESITQEDFDELNKELSAQLYEAESKLNQLIYIDNEIEKLQLRFKQFTTFLDELDVDNLTNVNLRKIIHSIVAETHEEEIEDPFSGMPYEKHTLRIHWNFMGTTEREILKESAKKAREIITTNSADYNLTADIIEEMAENASRRPTEDELLYSIETFSEMETS